VAIARRAPVAASRSPRLITPVGTIADWLTLLGAALIPNGGLALGGRLGFAYGDLVLNLAFAARMAHLLIGGLPMAKLRRQAFLLGFIGAFGGAGFISGLVNGNPVTFEYLFVVFALVECVVLVATFGGDDHREAHRRLAMAFAVGTTVLALSSFYSPTAIGRAIGYAIHPNALGHSLIMGLAVAVWLWDHAPSTRQRFVWAGSVVLCLGGIIESGSRGSTLAVGVFAIAYLALRGDLRVALAAVGVAWLATVALLAGGVELGQGNPIERLFVGNETSEYSDQERRNLLSDNLEDIGEDPIFGKSWTEIPDIHVVYFQGWVGGGFICALLLMLQGVTMLLLPLWQRRRDLALACGCAGLAVAWLFTNIFVARDQWLFIALAFGLSPSPLTLLRRADTGPAPTPT
jgi:hypothetical protein